MCSCRISPSSGTESKEPSQVAEKPTSPVQKKMSPPTGDVAFIPVRSLSEKNEKKSIKQMSSMSSAKSTEPSVEDEGGARGERDVW